VNHWVIPRYGILPRLLANETAVFQQFALVGIVDWPETSLDCHISTRPSMRRVVPQQKLLSKAFVHRGDGLQYESNYPYARYRYIMSVWIARP